MRRDDDRWALVVSAAMVGAGLALFLVYGWMTRSVARP